MNSIKLVAALAFAGLTVAACSKPYDVVEKSVDDLNADLAAGKITAAALTQAYIDRIHKLDGPIKSVLALNPKALDVARASDERRKAGKTLGPLDGIPILIKDNIDLAGMPTTAGSFALAENVPAQDSPLAHRLVAAGAVILGKANLSEWASARGRWYTTGWSAVGGLTVNPYDLKRSTCGSSAGSAAAGTMSFAAFTIGTETTTSVTCPANMNGLVGAKPTVGLVSRTGLVPSSHNQDTAGPLTRTVADAATALTAMAGSDPADPQTADAEAHKTDYRKGLDPNALKGARIGVLRFQVKGFTPQTQAIFENALAVLKAQGAELVEIVDFHFPDLNDAETLILQTDLKADLNAYLAKTPAAVKTRTLADIIAFNKAEPRELVRVFDQEGLEAAEATKGLDDPAYREALALAQRATGPEGLDRLLSENSVVALIQPTAEPAWLNDLATRLHNGAGGPGASNIPAMIGYPVLTVPMGAVSGLPVGISFIGPRWSEQLLLSLGYAYEQASHARRPPDGTAGKPEI